MKKVEVYYASYCPYSIKALELLDSKGVKYKAIEIDDEEQELRDRLGEYYNIEGKVTVPQIIVNNIRIGGYDKLKELDEQGKFEEVFCTSEE